MRGSHTAKCHRLCTLNGEIFPSNIRTYGSLVERYRLIEADGVGLPQGGVYVDRLLLERDLENWGGPSPEKACL